MSENTGRLLLGKSDFVDVVDEEDNVVASVPKHWGPDQLAAGTRKKGGSRRVTEPAKPAPAPEPTPSQPVTEPADPNKVTVEEPGGNASTEAWAKYATDVKGAKPGDLVDDEGKALSRDDLRARYGTPTGS